MIVKKIGRTLLSLVNKVLPKYKQVVIQGFPNVESSAVEVANYLSLNYKIQVYFAIDKRQKDNPRVVLDPKVIIINKSNLIFKIKYLTSKYIFFTHGSFLNSFSKKQVAVNLWHGILYKNVGCLMGKPGINATLTVGTSPITKTMFSKAFDVEEDSVVVSGYPRNDMLLRSKLNKYEVKSKIDPNLKSYDNIIIWMPTYRQSAFGTEGIDGLEVKNPFYIKEFDVARFDSLLRKNNALCIVKPHPMAPKFDEVEGFSNLLFIDEKWISDKEVNLYELVGCSDILISDVSSIMIDYLLLDQPIICVSEDFEEYKNSRGFYFDDIENWIPSKIIKDQRNFFHYLEGILKDHRDPSVAKRKFLKAQFFTHKDDKSTKRLINFIFEI